MGIVFLSGAIGGITVADQMLKQYIEENVVQGYEKPVIGGKVLIRKVYNEGFAMNAFDNHKNLVRLVSTAAAGLCTGYGIPYLLKKGCIIKKVGIVSLLGGAYSNLFDRLVRGYVIDYIAFSSCAGKGKRDLTYNIGDFFIFAGTVLIGLAGLFHRNKK